MSAEAEPAPLAATDSVGAVVAPAHEDHSTLAAIEPKPFLTVEESRFLSEERQIIKGLEDNRAHYLIAKEGLEEVKDDELATRREQYSRSLHTLIIHKCNYALASGDTGIENHTMGEHLLEIITTSIIHDRQKRDSVCDQLKDKQLGNRLRKFIETRPKFRYTVTIALGSAAILGAHVGILPDVVNPYIERVGEGTDALANGLAVFTGLSKYRRGQVSKQRAEELARQEDAMIGDKAATERFVSLLSDYVSRPHHDYFVDKVRQTQSPEELEKIIDELEAAIDQEAAHHDVLEIAKLVKLYHQEILADGGLLEELENNPRSSEAHKKLILTIMTKELITEETEHDKLSNKLSVVAAATIGAVTLGGGTTLGYHPIDSPLGELDEEPDKSKGDD